MLLLMRILETLFGVMLVSQIARRTVFLLNTFKLVDSLDIVQKSFDLIEGQKRQCWQRHITGHVARWFQSFDSINASFMEQAYTIRELSLGGHRYRSLSYISGV
jgi:hypothetical protein